MPRQQHTRKPLPIPGNLPRLIPLHDAARLAGLSESELIAEAPAVGIPIETYSRRQYVRREFYHELGDLRERLVREGKIPGAPRN